jgi:inner membrane protein
VTVYELTGHLEGSVEIVPPQTIGLVEWGEPYLAMSVEDVRGIVGTPTVVVNGTPETMLQGAESTMGWQPNLRVPLRGMKELNGHMEFAIDMNLAGTERLSVAPVGDSNHVELSVSSLATGTQLQMESNPVKRIDLMNVSLLTLIDPYKLTIERRSMGFCFWC